MQAEKGDTVKHRITVKDTNESAIDITGGAAVYTVRKNSPQGDIVIQETTSGNVTLSDPTNGKLIATIPFATMAGLEVGRKYFYDCQLTLSGERHTVQKGKFAVVYDVT